MQKIGVAGGCEREPSAILGALSAQRCLAAGLASLLILASAPAHAAGDPESGDQDPLSEESAPPVWDEVAPSAEETSVATSDHARTIGSIGIGLLGATTVPVGATNYLFGSETIAGVTPRVLVPMASQVLVPMIGARIWLSDLLGVQLGVGVGLLSGSNGFEDRNFAFTPPGASMPQLESNTVEGDGASSLALATRLSIPLALGSGEHVSFLVIPSAGFGWADGTDPGPNVDVNAPDDDRFAGGLLLEAGLDMALEVQMGMVGMPELAVQISTGIALRHESRNLNLPLEGVQGIVNELPPEREYSETTLRLGSSMAGEGAAGLISSLSLLYYL